MGTRRRGLQEEEREQRDWSAIVVDSRKDLWIHYTFPGKECRKHEAGGEAGRRMVQGKNVRRRRGGRWFRRRGGEEWEGRKENR